MNDTKSNSERQSTSSGSGGTDQPFYQMSVPIGDKGAKQSNAMPFELQHIIRQFGDIFMNAAEVRKNFEQAISNPSLKVEQKKIIREIASKLDDVNKIIANIPILLAAAFED